MQKLTLFLWFFFEQLLNYGNVIQIVDVGECLSAFWILITTISHSSGFMIIPEQIKPHNSSKKSFRGPLFND